MYWDPVSTAVYDADLSGLAGVVPIPAGIQFHCLAADSQENIATLWPESKGTQAEKHMMQAGDAAAKLFERIFICNVTAQQWEPSWVEVVGIICFDLVYFIAW